MRPRLALEHLEHRDVLGVERVVLDLLQMHGDEPPFAGFRDLVRGQMRIVISHGSIIGEMTAEREAVWIGTAFATLACFAQFQGRMTP